MQQLRDEIAARLDAVLQCSERAVSRRRAKFTHPVRLCAASKTQPAEVVEAYLQAAAQRGIEAIIGENYVQEFRDKWSSPRPPFSAHLIGPLQRNKARSAVKLFDVVASVQSLDVARAIADEAERIGKVQAVFLQVNVSSDQKKSGFDPEALVSQEVIAQLSALSALRIEGLMAITALYDQPEKARDDYKVMRELFERCFGTGGSLAGDAIETKSLSMGMSGDFEVAIEEGATLVRVGSALFGPRG